MGYCGFVYVRERGSTEFVSLLPCVYELVWGYTGFLFFINILVGLSVGFVLFV